MGLRKDTEGNIPFHFLLSSSHPPRFSFLFMVLKPKYQVGGDEDEMGRGEG